MEHILLLNETPIATFRTKAEAEAAIETEVAKFRAEIPEATRIRIEILETGEEAE